MIAERSWAFMSSKFWIIAPFSVLDMLLLALADYNLSLSPTYASIPSNDPDTLVREIQTHVWQLADPRPYPCMWIQRRIRETQSILEDLQ